MSDGAVLVLAGTLVTAVLGLWGIIAGLRPKPDSGATVAQAALALMEKLEERVNTLEPKLTDALSTIDRLRSQVSDAKTKLDDALAIIEDLEPRLAEALATIRRIEAERKAERAAYATEIAARDTERNKMQSELDELRAGVMNLIAQMDERGIVPRWRPKPKTGPLG